MKLGLTSRIILNFVLLSAVLLATVGVLSYRSGSKSLEDAAVSEMLTKAIEKEAALDAWMAERLSEIGEITAHADVVEKAARLIAAAPASQEARSAHAILLQELEPYVSVIGSNFTELFVIEAESGKTVASTTPAEEGQSKLGQPYFEHGKTNLYLQAIHYSADIAAPTMTAAVPMRAGDGRAVAVLAARLNLDAMNTITQRRTGLHQTEDAFLFNAEQFPITQPRFLTEPAVLRRKLDTEAVRLCVARDSGVTLAPDYRGVPSICVYRWNVRHQFGLIVKIDQAEALAPARAFGWSVALSTVLALLAAAALAFVVARTITQPLHTLQDRVRGFAEGNMEAPLQESSGNEVSLLAREFDQMAQRVGERTADLSRTNEALRASQQIIEGILNAIPVRVFWKDKNLVYLGGNAVFARDAGFGDPKDIIGKDDYQMGWREQAERYRADDRQVIESGSSKLLIEEPQTTPEGNTITLLTSKIPLRTPKGEVTGVLGTYLDITERKQAEMSEKRYRNLFDNAKDAIFTIAADGTFTSLNPVVETIAGICRSDWIGKPFAPMVHPDDLSLAMEMFHRILRGGQAPVHKLRGHPSLKRPAIMEMTLTAEKERSGKIIGLLGIGRDVTERSTVEAARDRLAAMLEATTDLVAIADPAGRLTYLNRAGRNLVGVGLDEDITSTAIRDFLPNPDRHPIFTEGIPAAIREGAWRGEIVILSRGGQEIPVSQVILTHKNQDGKIEFASTIMRDISERKKVEVEIETIHKQLVEASRLAGMAEVASSVLHNVGNALNSVNISTGLIVDSLKKSRASSLARIVVLLQEHAHDLGQFMTHDPRGRHVPAHLARLSESLMAEQAEVAGELDSLRRNVEHIKEIVAMQQNYATAGGVEEKIDLASLVEDSLRLNDEALRRHGVEVVRELEPVPPMTVEKHKILQILVNLVSNAKYACDESGRADGRLTVRLANGDGRVKISVIDNGIGIPPENLTRIFNHGFTTRKGGHGFGLHSSALAAQEMGGSLTVYSAGPGQGAAFTLELPCPKPDNPHE